MVAAQHGDGALLVNGNAVGYYNTVAASYGFQAGIQKFGYAMFFMTDASLNYLRKSGGFEVGSARVWSWLIPASQNRLAPPRLRKAFMSSSSARKG